MKNYHYFLVSTLCISFVSHAMEERTATVIENLSTKIFVKDINPKNYSEEIEGDQELYTLLRYPSDNFKKTDIINIITHPHDDAQKLKIDEYDFRVPKIEAIKQGTLDSLTADNITDIAKGYATYHYGIKSVRKENKHMNIGALVINKNVHCSDKKNKWDLMREHNAVCQAAIIRRINKNNNKTNELS